MPFPYVFNLCVTKLVQHCLSHGEKHTFFSDLIFFHYNYGQGLFKYLYSTYFLGTACFQIIALFFFFFIRLLVFPTLKFEKSH